MPRSRAVGPAHTVHPGKETNKLEEVEAGVEHDPEDIWPEYRDPMRDPGQDLVLLVLKRMHARDLPVTTKLSDRSVKALRNGPARPRPGHKEALCCAAATFVRGQNPARDFDPPPDHLAACAKYLGSPPCYLLPRRCPIFGEIWAGRASLQIFRAAAPRNLSGVRPGDAEISPLQLEDPSHEDRRESLAIFSRMLMFQDFRHGSAEVWTDLSLLLCTHCRETMALVSGSCSLR